MRKLLLFLLLFPACSFGQENFKPGYYINLQGDTIHGLVDYKEWHLNPTVIDFTKASGGNKEKITPENAKSITISGAETYQTHTVSISLNAIEDHLLTDKQDTSTIIQTVFLKVLTTGDKIDLLQYTDRIKNRFYILEKNKAIPEELTLQKTFSDNQIRTIPYYQGQLRNIALERQMLTPQLARKIENSGYSVTGVGSIIAKLNTESLHINTRKKKYTLVSFFAGFGLNIAQVAYTGKNLITIDRLNKDNWNKYKPKVTTTQITPRIAVGVEHYLNHIKRRMAVRVEFAAAQLRSNPAEAFEKFSNFNNHEKGHTYEYKSFNVSVLPQLLLNLVNHPYSKVYIAVGPYVQLNRVKQNELTTRYINQGDRPSENTVRYFNVIDGGISMVGRAGIQAFKHLDCSIIMGTPLKLIQDNSNTKISSTPLALMLMYKF